MGSILSRKEPSEKPGTIQVETGRSLEITIPAPPILDNRESVTLGFLTAAYLIWFRQFGYSFALQKHLETVRHQIQIDHLTAIPRSFCGSVPYRFQTDEPWLGFGSVNGHFALLTGISDRIVLFPAFDAPNLYDVLPATLQGARLKVDCQLATRHGVGHDVGPHAVIFDKTLAVVPDVFFKGRWPALVIHRSGASDFLHPVTSEQLERAKRAAPDAGISIQRTGVAVPETNTGQDSPHRTE